MRSHPHYIIRQPGNCVIQVCFADINADLGQQVAKELTEKYPSSDVTFLRCDVTSKEDLEGNYMEHHSTTTPEV